MATEIKIPIPDQTTKEVRIVKWRKQQGDAVAKGEVVLEAETDKSVIEIESMGAGVLLKRLNDENETVPVGEVVGYVGAAGEAVPGGGAGAKAQPAAAAASVSASAAPASKAATVTAGEGATAVKVPIPDQTTKEVRIVKWRKQEGDAVAKGEVVFEAETDKSVIEVESTASGVLLTRLFDENETVPVGQIVGYVGEKGTVVAGEQGQRPKGAEAQSNQSAALPKAAAPAAVTSAVSAGDDRLKASPLAKKIAGKMGIDLHRIVGSGPKGRIVSADVERHSVGAGAMAAAGGRLRVSPNARRLAKELGVELMGVRGSGPEGRVIGADVRQWASQKPAGGAAKVAPAAGQPKPGTEVEVSKMRRAIGKNLQMSFRDTPHFNVTMPIDMTRAIAFREQINDGRAKGDRISVNDLVLKAVAAALREWPAVNSRFTEEKISYLADVNIGVATALETGLVVPVVVQADLRSWDDLAKETKRIVSEARNGKIIGAGKGTFTVSNLGMFGVEAFTAIINPPEIAILAVGGVRDEVVAIDGMIGVRPMMRVTLCSDHRVIDGAMAAQFLQTVKRYLEEEIA